MHAIALFSKYIVEGGYKQCLRAGTVEEKEVTNSA